MIASTWSWWAGVMVLQHHAGPAPELAYLLDRLGRRAGRRGEDAPAPLEELGEPGFRPGMLGARHGMRRHEMHALRDVRTEIADHGLLHRAHIADDRSAPEPGRDSLADGGIGADGCADDDEVGPVRRFRRVMGRVVGDPEPLHGGQRLCAPGAGDNAAGQTVPLHRPGQGRADQADADQRDPFEHRLGHETRVLRAATTARLSSSRPTVMRRPSGKP